MTRPKVSIRKVLDGPARGWRVTCYNHGVTPWTAVLESHAQALDAAMIHRAEAHMCLSVMWVLKGERLVRAFVDDGLARRWAR